MTAIIIKMMMHQDRVMDGHSSRSLSHLMRCGSMMLLIVSFFFRHDQNNMIIMRLKRLEESGFSDARILGA